MIKRILMIDSDIGFTISLKKALEEGQQYAVRTVTRITPAVSALEETPYDVAVLDMSLDWTSPLEVMRAIRQIQPTLPVIITSNRETDAAEVQPLQAQRFLKKRYTARDLLALVEEVIAGRYSPYSEVTRAHVPINLDEFVIDDEELSEMLEASRQMLVTQPDGEEPPISDYDATISDVMEIARAPEVSRRIYTTMDLLSVLDSLKGDLPDEPTQRLIYTYMGEGQNPVAQALEITADPPSLDSIIEEIRAYTASSTPSPFSSSSLLQRLLQTDAANEADAPPAPPDLPDQAYLDTLHNAVIADEEAPLIQTTLEEMTQQLLLAEMQEQAEITPLPETILAHYAAQLTQFCLDNSAVGTLLTRQDRILAQAGNLPDEAWQTVLMLINDAWVHVGDAKTRIVYRRLAIGEVLLYSIQTVNEITLTLIFSADTSLKVIRKQALQLAESLQSIPPPPPVIPIPPPPVSLPEAPPVEQAAAPKPVRAPGSYIGYGCVWLLDKPSEPLDEAEQLDIPYWLAQICAERDWDFTHAQVGADWVAVWLEVPQSTLPSTIADTLMSESMRFLMPEMGPKSTLWRVWSDGYLIMTPASQLGESEIQRFQNFYRRERQA